MCFLLLQWVLATCHIRAQIIMRAELSSGKIPNIWVQRTSRFSFSRQLLVRMRVKCLLGKSQYGERLLNVIFHLLGNQICLGTGSDGERIMVGVDGGTLYLVSGNTSPTEALKEETDQAGPVLFRVICGT